MAEALPPRSWAEDLNTYRSTRGSLAFSTVQSAKDVPRRICRTTLMPFANPNHPYYSYQEPQYHANEHDGSLERYRRHGWGTASLTAHAETRDTALQKVTCRAAPQSKVDMFSVLQLRNPQNLPDAWFGNAAIDPSAGKKSVAQPPDPKGRKSLFQVLSQAEAAPASSDSWLGNTLIDPSLGKRSCERPDQRLGRPNLFPLMQQSVLRAEPSGKRLHQNKAFADVWIGNPLISPTAGKSHVDGSVQSQCTLRGAQLGPTAPESNFGKIGRRPVRNSGALSTLDDLERPPRPGEPNPADVDWKRRVKSRRHFDTLPRNRPETIDIVQCKNDTGRPFPGPPRWTEDGPVSSKSMNKPFTQLDPDGGFNCQFWNKEGQGRPPAKPTIRVFHTDRPAATMPPCEKKQNGKKPL